MNVLIFGATGMVGQGVLRECLLASDVSGVGTDSTERGSSMWARVKGRTENALRRLPFKAGPTRRAPARARAWRHLRRSAR
jgi:nucleoside-diphosphate-sugar epimerase